MEQKRDVYIKIIAFGVAGIFLLAALACALLLPRAFRVLQHADEAIQTAQTTIETAQDTLELGKETIEQISGMTDSMETVLDQVNKIDYATLNEAINDLHDTVQPFANLMQKFK